MPNLQLSIQSYSSFMKSRYLIFFIIIIFSFTTKASSVDSLLRVVNVEKKDINTVNALIKITKHLRSNYPDSAAIYANQAFRLSKKIGFSEGSNSAVYELSVIEYYKGNYDKSLEYIVLSKKLLKKEKGLKRKLASTLLMEGTVYKKMGNFSKAIEIYNECLQVGKKLKDHHFWILASNNKANIYRRQGNHDVAIQMLEAALELSQKHNLKKDEIMVLGNIGLVYKSQGEYEMALIYLKKVLLYLRENNNKRNIAINLNNIGNIYSEQEKYNEALKAHQEALKIRENIGDKSGEASSFLNIGSIYLRAFKDYDNALKFTNRSLKISEEIQSDNNIASALLAIAEINKEQRNYEEAIVNAKSVLKILKNVDRLELREDAYDILSKSYEAIGGYREAISYFREHQAVRDSLFSQNNRDAISNLMQKHQTEQYEDRLNRQLDKAKANRSFYLGVISFLIVLGFLSFYSIRQKQVANSKLQQLNDEVNARNDELLMTQNSLKVANQDLNSFTRIASHDLKEPLRMMSSFSQLLKRRNKNLDKSSQEYIIYITDAAQRMSRMLDDMLSYATHSIHIENMEYLDVNKILETVKQNLGLRIEENNATINVSNKLPQIKGQASLIEQVFQNLIANGIKFQHPDVTPAIIVTGESTAQESIFRITDNGIGIAPENQDKVFQLFKRFNQEYEGSGIGLTTCKKIVGLHNGTIELESEKGKGTTFILRFLK